MSDPSAPNPNGLSATSSSRVISGAATKMKGAATQLENLGVLPKIQPIPWTTFLVLLIFVSVPPIGFCVAFSSIGYGEDYVAAHNTDRDNLASVLTLLIAMIMGTLYMMDFSYWQSLSGNPTSPSMK